MDTTTPQTAEPSGLATEQLELRDTNVPSDEHSEFFSRPVTDSVTAQAGSYIDFPNGQHSEFVDRRVTESVTAQTESNKNCGRFRIFRPTGHGVGNGTGR